jgi:hypothetical protein
MNNEQWPTRTESPRKSAMLLKCFLLACPESPESLRAPALRREAHQALFQAGRLIWGQGLTRNRAEDALASSCRLAGHKLGLARMSNGDRTKRRLPEDRGGDWFDIMHR